MKEKRNPKIYAALILIFVVHLGCFLMIAEAKPTIKKDLFGKTSDGKQAEIFTLTNSNGIEAKIMTYGGTVVSLKIPDKNGKFADVVLGYETLAEYEKDSYYLGAIIGRYANRIAKGRFSIEAKEFVLARNNGENHLHGGLKGFDKVVWKARAMADNQGANLELTYLSRDGEEGYPGNLSVKVIYSLTENNALKIAYSATTDKKTVVNLTHHSYFNLAGAGNGDILNHQLTINADKFTPTDAGSIPTGELKSVNATPFDFLTPTVIGKRINLRDEQLIFGNGYDHNWVLNKKDDTLTLAASVFEPSSKRRMEVWTTEPGIQFYAGNYLDKVKGKNGKIYDKREGFCLETQHFPDSPNKSNFPSTILKKGEKFSSVTVYKFTVS